MPNIETGMDRIWKEALIA